MRNSKITLALIGLACSLTTTFAATIQRGNLLIDLDTGEITIVNTNSEYQSLIEDANNSTNNTGSSSEPTTPTTPDTTTNTGTNTITTGVVIPTTSSILSQAIARGYAHGITKFDNETDFQPDNAILRQEAAKMFMQAVDLFDYTDTSGLSANCSFSDLEGVPADLLSFINTICSHTIMVGSQWQFRPFGTLTQAEGITLISRLANEGDLTTTSQGVWREKYRHYVTANKLLAHSSISYNTIDQKVSRADIIIMLYTLSQSEGLSSPDTGTNTPTPPTNSSSNISIGKGITDDPEFLTALLWMYNNGLTQYPDAENYNPYDLLTREWGAKFFAIYDKKFDTHTTTGTNCNFSDIASSTQKDHINSVCTAGIMRGDGKTFRATDTISKAEFMAAMLNMINEPSTATDTLTRQQSVYNKALSLELISQADLATFDKALTRYEAALLIYKFYIKNRFIASLNSTNTTHNIIATVSQDNSATGSNQQKVFIDVNTIDNKDFTNGFIDIMGTNYALVKKQISQYFPTSYIRYGDIKDITNDTVIGTISFTIGQQWLSKSIMEGYISFDDNRIFTITASNQSPYYLITKLR